MIIPRLPDFLAKHPSLNIDILLDDRVIDVVAEGVDVALRMGTLTDSTAVARKLATGKGLWLLLPLTWRGLACPKHRPISFITMPSSIANSAIPGFSDEATSRSRQGCGAAFASVQRREFELECSRIWDWL